MPQAVTRRCERPCCGRCTPSTKATLPIPLHHTCLSVARVSRHLLSQNHPQPPCPSPRSDMGMDMHVCMHVCRIGQCCLPSPDLPSWSEICSLQIYPRRRGAALMISSTRRIISAASVADASTCGQETKQLHREIHVTGLSGDLCHVQLFSQCRAIWCVSVMIQYL